MISTKPDEFSATSSPAGWRERKKARTHAAFIDTGLYLFAERGYETVTVDDICDAVGVSPRTFFRYFATKADLVSAEFDRGLGDLLADLRAQPEGTGAWDALTHALVGIAGTMANRRHQHLALHTVTQDSPELVAGKAASLLEWEQQMTAEVASWLPSAAGDNARLMTGIALTAFRVTRESWLAGGAEDDMRGELVDALAKLQPAAVRLASPP